MRPIIIVNFKTYPQATGANAVSLAKICQSVGRKCRADVRVAVQATDLTAVSKAVRIPVYAQHVDVVKPGKSTGWVTAHSLKKAKAKGTLLNHAEHRLSIQAIRNTTPHLRRERMDIVAIAGDIKELHLFERYVDADILCIEPPELIGGELSVATARPELISAAVDASKRPLLVGAGIKDHRDLAVALSLGARGVLISSHVVLAHDQRRALERLIAP